MVPLFLAYIYIYTPIKRKSERNKGQNNENKKDKKARRKPKVRKNSRQAESPAWCSGPTSLKNEQIGMCVFTRLKITIFSL